MLIGEKDASLRFMKKNLRTCGENSENRMDC